MINGLSLELVLQKDTNLHLDGVSIESKSTKRFCWTENQKQSPTYQIY